MRFQKFGIYHNYHLSNAAHFMAGGDWVLRWTGVILGPIALGWIWREKAEPGAVLGVWHRVEADMRGAKH